MATSEPNAAPRGSRSKPRLVVLGAGDRPAVAKAAQSLRIEIERHAEVLAWDLSFTADLSGIDADFAVVLGGDGSILHAAHQMRYSQLPVIGVNLGKLGFLADLAPDELPRALPLLASGQCRVIEHLMFECRVLRGEKVVAEQLGLNEVAVRTGAPYRILDVNLYVDAELVTTYSCDGLIVSTPIGSTAHCLSAGGPILRKELQAFVIVPISPHTLTNRPVVDSADRVYELVVPEPGAETAAVVDGHALCALEPHDRVRIERSRARFKLVEVPGHTYYRTLREKLGWGGRLQLGS